MNYREEFTLLLQLFGDKVKIYDHEILYESFKINWIYFLNVLISMKPDDFSNYSSTIGDKLDLFISSYELSLLLRTEHTLKYMREFISGFALRHSKINQTDQINTKYLNFPVLKVYPLEVFIKNIFYEVELNSPLVSFVDLININPLFNKINYQIYFNEFKDTYIKLINCTKKNHKLKFESAPAGLCFYKINEELITEINNYIELVQKFFCNRYACTIVNKLIGNVLKVIKKHANCSKKWGCSYVSPRILKNLDGEKIILSSISINII
jgi:hypothetical protein